MATTPATGTTRANSVGPRSPSANTGAANPLVAPSVKAKQMTSTNVQLTWSLTRSAGSIKIDYVVHNNTDHAIWVADELLQNTVSGRVMKARPELIVRNGPAPDIVSFVRGMTQKTAPTGRARPSPPPAMKQVAAKGTAQGEAIVPVPLVAWHNSERIPPLAGAKTRAILEISYMDEPAADAKDAMRQVPLEDNRTVPAPSPYYFQANGKRVTSDLKALP